MLNQIKQWLKPLASIVTGKTGNPKRTQAERLLRLQRDLGIALGTTSDLTGALNRVLETTLQVEEIDSGGVYLVDDRQTSSTSPKELNLVVHKGLPPQFVEVVSHFEADSPQARLVMAGEPVYQQYLQFLPETKDQVRQSEGLRAMAVIPVKYENAEGRSMVVAALNLASHTHDEIPGSTRDMLEAIATQIGGAIGRIKAETALKQSQRNLQAIFDTLDDFLFILGADGHILYFNPVVERRLGYSAETLATMNVIQVHPPERRAEAAAIVADMVAGKRTMCPVPLLAKDGTLIPVETKVTQGQWNNQEVLFGLTRDITERKQAEEKLELSERRLKEAQRIAHLGSWEMDVATGKSHWSDEFFRICGYEPGAFEPSADIGFQIIHPDDRERAAEAVTKAIEEEKVYSIEKRIVRPNGEVRHVLSQGELIHDENGQPVKMLGSFLDITERKRVEEALRESEKKYRNIIESIPLGMHMYQLEPDGRLVFTGANPAADRILGVDNSRFIGQTIGEAFPALTQTEVPEQYRRVASRGAAWQTDQITYEENQISGAFEVHAFQTSPGKMVAAFLDITERKQAEERLKKIAAELEAANAELSQYTYVVSHDLRAPLRAIHNYADFIREDLAETLDGDLRQYLDGLGSAVCEAEELVGDLLELSRIGRMSVPVEPVDVGLFLHKQIEVLGLPEEEVEVAMAEDWPTIEVEPVLLGQIFQNLISNAVKFNRSPHKRIELGWRPVGEGRPESDSSPKETGAYEFFIRDNGIGIAPRYQEQIFHLFERLHTKQEYEGTGIGLAIVKKAVEQLHGSVRIESEPGQGSTFFVTLPRH